MTNHEREAFIRRFEEEARIALGDAMLCIPAEDGAIFRDYALDATIQRLAEDGAVAIKDVLAYFVALSVAYLMTVPCSQDGVVQ